MWITEFFSSFLIAFREILEMILIIGIIFLYLNKTDQKQMNKYCIYGILAGLIGSLAIAVLLSLGLETVVAFGEELIEGLTALLAAGIITYVIFWMAKNKNIKQAIHSKVQQALDNKEIQHQALGLFALSFFAVLREGFELVLLISLTTFHSFDAVTLTAVIFGIGTALLFGFILFKTAIRLNLNLVFKITAIFLALFAAGLIVTGLHALSEGHFLPEFQTVLDVSPVLNHETNLFGQILNTIFGYRSTLTALELIAYFAYLAGIYLFYSKITNTSSKIPAVTPQ